MFIPKATCYGCKVPFQCEKNDVDVRMNSSFGPYYIISGDVWRCPKCGTQIITGFPEEPHAMNHEDGFGGIPFDVEVQL